MNGCSIIPLTDSEVLPSAITEVALVRRDTLKDLLILPAHYTHQTGIKGWNPTAFIIRGLNGLSHALQEPVVVSVLILPLPTHLPPPSIHNYCHYYYYYYYYYYYTYTYTTTSSLHLIMVRGLCELAAVRGRGDIGGLFHGVLVLPQLLQVLHFALQLLCPLYDIVTP